MEDAAIPSALDAAARERGYSLAFLSRLIDRNPAYLQQFVKRGTPRRLAEADRAKLARFLGLSEAALGAPATHGDGAIIPWLDVAAAAGHGAHAEGARRLPLRFDPDWLRLIGVREADAAMIEVVGDSMAPTLCAGDRILVDTARRTIGARGGLFVLRHDAMLLVKRLRRVATGIAIISDNPDWDDAPIVAAEAIVLIGCVAWLGRVPD